MECFHGDRRALFPVTLASRCDPGASRARPQLPLCSWSPGEVPGQPGLLPIPSPAGLWGAMGCSALLQGLSAAPTLAAGSSRNCPSWRGDRAGLQKSQISAAVGLQGSITPHPGGRRAGTPHGWRWHPCAASLGRAGPTWNEVAQPHGFWVTSAASAGHGTWLGVAPKPLRERPRELAGMSPPGPAAGAWMWSREGTN